MDAGRANKLADRIAKIVAEMLERRVKDPRLGFVTVTDAKVTGDLREATVYYTVYGSADEQAGTAAALESATGLIRSEGARPAGDPDPYRVPAGTEDEDDARDETEDGAADGPDR